MVFMIFFSIGSISILALLAIYSWRKRHDKEDIFDATTTLASIILCVGFILYSVPDNRPSRAWPVTVVSSVERHSIPVVTAPSKPIIPEGPSNPLSKPANDVRGLIKWTSIKKGIYDVSEAWVGREDDNVTRYNFHGRVNNKSDKIIAGFEIEVTIHDCGKLGGDRKNFPIIGSPIRETTIGRVVQPHKFYYYIVRLPFFGPKDNYEFEIKPTPVAEWLGPPTSSTYVSLNESLPSGYDEFSFDKMITCSGPYDEPISAQINEQSGEVLRADFAQTKSC